MIVDIKKQVRGPALYQYHPLFILWKTIIDQPYYSTPIMSNLVNKVSLSKLSFINQLRKENWQILQSNTKSVMAVPTGYCRPIRLYLMSPGGTVLVPMHTDDQQQHQRELSRAHTHSRTRYQKVGPGGSIKAKLHQSHYKCKQANQIVQ